MVATPTRVPIASACLDRIVVGTYDGDPLVANRIPAPKILAQLETQLYQPYSLTDGMEMVLHTPEPAVSVSVSEPYTLSDGDTLELRIDSGYIQEIILSGLTPEAATAEEVCRSIALQLRLAKLSLTDNSTTVSITTKSSGINSSIKFVGGTALAPLGFTDTYGIVGSELITFSSADFLDITAALASEVAGVITLQSTRVAAAVTIEEDRIHLLTDYDELYCDGEAAQHLGLLPWAQVECAINEPYALTENADLLIKVDNGVIQKLIFDSNPIANLSLVSADYLVQQLNFKLKGATADLTPDGQRILIRSNSEGSTSAIEVTGGTINEAVNFGAKITGAGKGAATYYLAQDDQSVKFDVFDTGTSGIKAFLVYITTNYETNLIYASDSLYIAPDWTASVIEESSPGATNPDVLHVTLSHSTPFISEEQIYVRVTIETNNSKTYDGTYVFDVEDTRRPRVIAITPWTPNVLRVRFSEPMDQVTDGPLSSLYTRDVSGRIRYYASTQIGELVYPAKIEAPNTSFTTDDIGLYIGSAGARNAVNNFVAEITGIQADSEGNYIWAEVDVELVNESPPAAGDREPPPRVVVSPYRVKRHPSLDAFTPSFVPIVLEADAVAESDIPVGDEAGRYVQLSLHDSLSPSIQYQLELTKISDPSGNPIGSLYSFNSWNLRNVPGRNWNLLEELPQYNWDEDQTGDLLKLMNCFNEVAQVLLNDIDSFGDLFDPWTVKPAALDRLLEHMGNPFTFTRNLTEMKKRELAALLPYLYKIKGTDASIEDSVYFFLKKEITVVPWQGHNDAWTLGVSELGVGTYLDPSKSFIRFSFIIQHAIPLSEEEKTIIDEIVHFARPNRNHFLGYEYTG